MNTTEEELEEWKERHDPDDIKPYTFRFLLPSGVSIVIATVEAVKPDLKTVDLDTDLVLDTPSLPSWGVISGNVWGVTFYPTGGTSTACGEPSKRYPLRCRFTNDAVPPETFDRTMILVVREL